MLFTQFVITVLELTKDVFLQYALFELCTPDFKNMYRLLKSVQGLFSTTRCLHVGLHSILQIAYRLQGSFSMNRCLHGVLQIVSTYLSLYVYQR